MNIFILDSDVNKCAQYHLVKHINKMQVELSQLLCAALHQNPELRPEIKQIPYKLTHANHPCTIFTRKSPVHYSYVAGLLYALNVEYQRRYNKTHLSFTKMYEAGLVTDVDYVLANNKFSEIVNDIPKCMPDEYKVESVIESYRNYYRLGKVHLHDWAPANKPDWI